MTVTTRRSLDVLRSARVQREEYPGTWLPEPIATDADPGMDVERRESLTMGFLVLLERLTPIERAVFVLHDVLDHPYELVAEAVGRSEDACRQALSRARKHVTVPARRTPAERQQAEEVAARFMTVGIGGDIDALLAALAPDVVVTSDGGGVARAAIRPVVGPDRVARFLANLGTRIGRRPARGAVRDQRAAGRGREHPRRVVGAVGGDRGRRRHRRPHRRQPGEVGAPRRLARARRPRGARASGRVCARSATARGQPVR